MGSSERIHSLCGHVHGRIGIGSSNLRWCKFVFPSADRLTFNAWAISSISGRILSRPRGGGISWRGSSAVSTVRCVSCKAMLLTVEFHCRREYDWLNSVHCINRLGMRGTDHGCGIDRFERPVIRRYRRAALVSFHFVATFRETNVWMIVVSTLSLSSRTPFSAVSARRSLHACKAST